MKFIRITPLQASFLEIEIADCYYDDEDANKTAVAAIVAARLRSSYDTEMAVPSETLAVMLLDAANGIDDEIEAARKGDVNALGRIGGIETIAEARRLHQTAIRLLGKARAA